MKKIYCSLRVSAINPDRIYIDSEFTNDVTRECRDCWLRFKTYIHEHVNDFLGKEFIKIIKNLDFYSTDDCEWLDMTGVSSYYDKVIQDIETCHEYYIAIKIKPDIKTDLLKHQVNTVYGMKLKDHSGRDPWKSNKDPKECYISTSTWHQNALTEYFAKKSDILDKGTIDGTTWDYITRDEEVTKMEKKDTPKELQRKHIDGCKRALYKTYITRVIFNDKATILFFTDGSKSVVKCTETDNYSREAGIALAYLKHKIGKESFHYVMNALTGKKGETVEALDTFYHSNIIKVVDKTNKEDKNND